MKTNYLPNPAKTPEIDTIPTHEPQQEPIQTLLIGSPDAVTNSIHTLYRLGYAQVGEWSPPQPTQKPGQVVSMLTRQITIY